MNEISGSFHVINFPPERRGMPRFNAMYWGRHCIYGLVEVDVTRPKQFMEQHKARTGETLSFTGYLAVCLARAVDENKMVQTYVKGGNRLVLFDDVDIGLMVEHREGDKRALMGHVVRRANHKSFREIHEEIRAVQANPRPQGGGIPSWIRSFIMMPEPVSGWFISFLKIMVRRDPTVLTSLAGTVGITAIGMFGKGTSGWGVAPLEHVLDLVVGGIARKPAVVGDRIEPREVLNLTVVFDHDVIDGAPAARFARRLVELVQDGYGLDEYQSMKAYQVPVLTDQERWQ